MSLTTVYSPAGAGAASSAKAPNVDIVLVHGLDGDATKSWTHSRTKKCWPKDFLPRDFPDARVLTFGYNAVSAFGSTTAGIVDHANGLLASLVAERDEAAKLRPIIFIAHSLGGIIVKQALCSARIDPQFSEIFERTAGIMFFGTPHSGSEMAAYGKILAGVASTILYKPASKLVKALQSNSTTLAQLTSDFKHQLPDYQIVSFYETRAQAPFKKEIVGKHSALLQTPREYQIPVDANHSDMCKFSDADNGTYKQLVNKIPKILEAKKETDQANRPLRNKYYLVPHHVSATFTGREDVCKQIRDSCTSPHPFTIQRRFVLFGLGGSGKTQVSLKFAQDYREKYWKDSSVCQTLTILSFWGVFWIDCSSEQTITHSFIYIAQKCKTKDEVIGEDLNSIRTWLANHTEPWLMIYDNADDPSIDLSRFFPLGSRGTILITTRNPRCEAHKTVGSYEFSGMGQEDAVDLLLKNAGKDMFSKESRQAASGIATVLGNLALAIVQAGATIAQGLCHIEDYCVTYQRHRKRLLKQSPEQASSDYKYTVYTTWEISIEMIENLRSEISNHALDLLNMFSFLHFDGISEEIFARAWHDWSTYKDWTEWEVSNHIGWLYKENCTAWDPFSLREATSLLSSFSLIKIETWNNSFSMHPLVHTWTRDRMTPKNQRQWALTSGLELARSINYEETVSAYASRRSTVPHITDLIVYLIPEIIFSPGYGEKERIEIAEKFSWIFYENGQYQNAIMFREKMVEAERRTFGEEHVRTLRTMKHLAESYRIAGQIQMAVNLHEEVLDVWKRTSGEEHPDTLMSISDLALCYSALDRNQDALMLDEKVLEVRKRVLGEEHLETLRSMNNLARSYANVARFQEAAPLHEKSLELRKRILGEEHPATLTSMNNLAASYADLGRSKEALALQVETLDLRIKILGEEHPSTLLSMSNLALRYYDVGQLSEALALGEKAFEMRKRVLGGNHADTLRSKNNLEFYVDRLAERDRSRRERRNSEDGDNGDDCLAVPDPAQNPGKKVPIPLNQAQATNPVPEQQAAMKSRSGWDFRSLVKRSRR